MECDENDHRSENLNARPDEVVKWFAEGGGEIALSYDGVAWRRLLPHRRYLRPPGKADWARRFREWQSVGRPLTKEETEAFYESLKRDF